MKGISTMKEITKEQVNHPDHYNKPGRKECIVEMREKFGDEKVKAFCGLSAYKYEYRAGEKGNAETDLKKAEWYKQYMKNMDSNDE